MVGICTQTDKRSVFYDRPILSGVDTVVYQRPMFYDPTPGRFTTLDPFAGNTNDPQSLHKYLYTQADPVNGADPSGKFLTDPISITVWSLVALFGGYVAWSQFGPESFAQWGTPDAWLASAKGPSAIRGFQAGYQAPLCAGSLYFGDPSLDVNGDLGSRCYNPLYQDANLGAIFDEYAAVYSRVTSRRCDLALKYLADALRPWVADHQNATRGITFLMADWQVKPDDVPARPGLEDDNILVLLPNEYYNEATRDVHNTCLTDPGWYNTVEKRNILYFYPGSSPVQPVGRLYDDFVSSLYSRPRGQQVPRLRIWPEGCGVFPA